MAIAVLIGVILAALAYTWENAKRIRARKYLDKNGVKHYEILGRYFLVQLKLLLKNLKF